MWSDRPTILLTSYNFKEFLLASIASALAQMIPCRIVFSDDASSDGSFEFAQTVFANYRHTDYEIVLRRNTKNIGGGEHVRLLSLLFPASLQFQFDGDDISMPNRVERQCKYFEENPKLMAQCSSFVGIDQSGALCEAHTYPLEPYSAMNLGSGEPFVVGGMSLAWRHVIISKFPQASDPAPSALDVVSAFRAALLGTFQFFPDHLIQYRIRTTSMSREHNSNDGSETSVRHGAHIFLKVYRGLFSYMQKDLLHAVEQNWVTKTDQDRIQRLVLAPFQRKERISTLLIENRNQTLFFTALAYLPHKDCRALAANAALIAISPTLHKWCKQLSFACRKTVGISMTQLGI